MANADDSTLAALIAPHSAQGFLRDYWPHKAFAAHGDPARLPAFLRAPELESVDTLSRVYRGNLRFTSGRRYQKMLAIDQVHAVSLYRMGLTVQFEDIAPCIAATSPGLQRLEAELGVATGAARAVSRQSSTCSAQFRHTQSGRVTNAAKMPQQRALSR